MNQINQTDDKELYNCICSCGNKVNCKREKLRSKFPSCGCYYNEIKLNRAKELEGFKFFNKTVKKFIKFGCENGNNKSRAIYEVKCKCGNTYEQSVSHLFSSKSCGCLQGDFRKGDDNPHIILSDSDVLACRELFKSGLYTRIELSEMMNYSYSGICSIINNKIRVNI